MKEIKAVEILNKTTGARTVGRQTLKVPQSESPTTASTPVVASVPDPEEDGLGVTESPVGGANPSGPGDGGTSSKEKKRRAPIDSIRGLIEYGYSRRGQRVLVKRDDLKQIAARQTLTDQDRTELKSPILSDRLLAVPRQFLLLSRDLTEVPTLRNELREFVREVLHSHPIFLANGLDPAMQDANGALNLREAFSRIASTSVSQLKDVTGGDAIKPTELEELKRNAIGCLGAWAVETRGVSIADLITALLKGYWASRSQDAQSEAEALRALTDIKDPVSAGLICGEFRRRTDEQARFADASRRAAEAATVELRRVVTELEAAKARVADLEGRIVSLTREAEAERDSARIAQTHLKDDLETLRTRLLRRLTEDVSLLGDGLVALGRVPPKVDVMSDHAERAIGALKKEIKKLESGG